VHRHLRADPPLRTCFIIAMLGFLAVVLGGYLGYYVHWTLFTLMPLGALTTARICWRVTRV